jgi:hypothetical protein
MEERDETQQSWFYIVPVAEERAERDWPLVPNHEPGN